MRKATTKASIAKPAPKVMASSVSRTKPVIRDGGVITLTEAADFSRFMRGGGRKARAGGRKGRERLGLCFDRTSEV